MSALPDLMKRWYTSLTTNAENVEVPLVATDARSPTQRVVSASVYNATTILSLVVIDIGTGNLTLSPLDGSTDIVISAADLATMGIVLYNRTWHGPFDSITAGAGMKILAYTR